MWETLGTLVENTIKAPTQRRLILIGLTLYGVGIAALGFERVTGTFRLRKIQVAADVLRSMPEGQVTPGSSLDSLRRVAISQLSQVIADSNTTDRTTKRIWNAIFALAPWLILALSFLGAVRDEPPRSVVRGVGLFLGAGGVAAAIGATLPVDLEWGLRHVAFPVAFLFLAVLAGLIVSLRTR